MSSFKDVKFSSKCVRPTIYGTIRIVFQHTYIPTPLNIVFTGTLSDVHETRKQKIGRRLHAVTKKKHENAKISTE